MFGFQKYCLHLSGALVREISTLWCHKGRQLLVQVYDKTSNQVSSLLGRSNIASEFWQEAKTSSYLHISSFILLRAANRGLISLLYGDLWRGFFRLFYRCARLLLQTSQVLALPAVTALFGSPSKLPASVLAACCKQMAKYTVVIFWSVTLELLHSSEKASFWTWLGSAGSQEFRFCVQLHLSPEV